MEVESRLIPVLLEGVDVIKMVFFKKLKTHLADKYPDRETSTINQLAGAIVNELFGVSNPAEPFAEFYRQNQRTIEKELASIATELAEMRIPLTDALRVQFFCDHQEGIDSSAMLGRARQLDVLLLDREVPLPAPFLSLVRKLGSAFEVLHPHHIAPGNTQLH
jgi:hypothetical protein